MYGFRWIVALVLALAGAGLGVMSFFRPGMPSAQLAGLGAIMILVALFVPPIGGARPEFRVLGLVFAAICLARAGQAGWHLLR